MTKNKPQLAYLLRDRHTNIVIWVGLEKPRSGFAGGEAYWNYDPTIEEGWTFKANARLERTRLMPVTKRK